MTSKEKLPSTPGEETGRFLALDLGGTNFRVLVVDIQVAPSFQPAFNQLSTSFYPAFNQLSTSFHPASTQLLCSFQTAQLSPNKKYI
jgi:hexokinase